MSVGKQAAADAASAAAAGSKYQVGTAMSVDWSQSPALVTVNLPPGGEVEMPMVGDPPVLQRPCLVAFLGMKPVCVGTLARPVLGTVAGSPANGLLPVKADDGVTYQLAYNTNITSWVSNARVQIDWSAGGTVLCAVSADPYTHDDTRPVPPPVVPSKPHTGSTSRQTFQPTDSGTQNASAGSLSGKGNYWTQQVYCGDTTLGAYFYGGQLASTIPDNASITKVEVYLQAVRSSGANPTIGVHSLSSKSGNIVVDQATTVSLGTGWKTLPNAFGEALKTGARRGLATAHGGYSIYAPAGSGSGQLRITWRNS